MSSLPRFCRGCHGPARRCPAASSTIRGRSKLFEKITRLPEYYPTRAETTGAAAASRRLRPDRRIESALADASRRLAGRFPALEVWPIVANFAYPVAFPTELAGRQDGLFPRLDHRQPHAHRGFASFARLPRVLSSHGRLIVGIDVPTATRRA
jgi:uncharacterized SAM-dependent methyltransferase